MEEEEEEEEDDDDDDDDDNDDPVFYEITNRWSYMQSILFHC